MQFCVIGGDRRSVYLCSMLASDGHGVSAYALERALSCKASLHAAAQGAQAVILPMPGFRDGCVYAPLSDVRVTVQDLSDMGPIPMLAYHAKELQGRVRYLDYGSEVLTWQNAHLTADAALGLLLTRFGTLQDTEILIGGFGRIGSFLAGRVHAVGGRVSVCARSPVALAQAACHGYGTRALPCEDLSGFAGFVNTIPAHVYDPALQSLQGCICWDLASPPYGLDLVPGLEVIRAPGLPGQCAPERAAQYLKESIYTCLGGDTQCRRSEWALP